MEGASLKRLIAVLFVMVALGISSAISEPQSSNSSSIEASAPESEQPSYSCSGVSPLTDASSPDQSEPDTDEEDELDISPRMDASAAEHTDTQDNDVSDNISPLMDASAAEHTGKQEEDVLDMSPLTDASAAEHTGTQDEDVLDIDSFTSAEKNKVDTEAEHGNEESLMLRIFPRITRTRFHGCGRRCFRKCFKYVRSNVSAKIRLCQRTCHHRCDYYYRHLRCRVHCVKALPHVYRHGKNLHHSFSLLLISPDQ